MFEFLIKKLKAHPRKIVFTEGTDPRILEASARLLSGTFLTPVLVGNADEITKAAEEAGFNIRGAEIMDPAIFPDMDKMVALMVELRKGKMTEEQCRKSLSQANYFGTMLVKMGYADALLGGATYSGPEAELAPEVFGLSGSAPLSAGSGRFLGLFRLCGPVRQIIRLFGVLTHNAPIVSRADAL